jgi:V/A-type H+-transporting ATPase subunit C
MIGRRAKAGNYPYATTRVKARKAFLFPRETYLKLMQMDLPEISRFIGESKYKDEIDELATKYSGIDLLEYALNLNMAREMNQIMSFCQGELNMLVGAYLMRWDTWNIKSILRGRYYGASEDEIRETLVPAGDLRLSALIELARKASIPDVIEGLNGTIFYKPLYSALEDFNKTKTLSSMENSLDRVYYANLLSLDLPDSKADDLFISFIRREIDVVNLRTMFRLKRQGLEHEKIMEYMVAGGAKLGIDDLKKLAQAQNFDEFVNMLKEYAYWSELAEAIDKSRETRSLNPVEVALRKLLIGYSDKISHLYPLSICPIMGYVVRKNAEVNNLRIIARGKEMHLSDETIRSQLVI